MIRAVELANDTVRVIDQTVLPHEVRILTLEDPDAVARAIREMRVRGAPAIGVTAAFGLVLAALRHEGEPGPALDRHIDQTAATLTGTRPTAVNLTWAIERMRHCYAENRTLPLIAIREALRREALAIQAQDEEANRRMGHHGASLVPPRARVLTHCNTGNLATAGFGTALGVIRTAHDTGHEVHVWVDETRPYLQGARLTAWELGQLGIPHTLVTDSMAGLLMARGLVDLVIVGADRVTARGDVANKIGTYPLAVLAEYHHVPFYVAAPLSTVDLSIKTGDQVVIEERAAREVTHVGDTEVAPPGTAVFNPSFDVTPHYLVDAIVTEVGVLRPPFGPTLRAVKEGRPPRER